MAELNTAPAAKTNSAPAPFTPIRTDLAPQRGFFSACLAKCNELVKSALHSGRALDNLEKIGGIPSQLGKPVQHIDGLIASAPTDIRDNLIVARGAFGTLLAGASSSLERTLKVIDAGLERITGRTTANLGAFSRRTLSSEQRAKIVDLSRQCEGQLKAAEAVYNSAGTKVNELHKVLSNLISKEREVGGRLIEENGELVSVAVTSANAKDIDIKKIESQGFDGLGTKLVTMFKDARKVVFNTFSDTKNIDSDPDVAFEAARQATHALDETGKALESFASSARTAATVIEDIKFTQSAIKDQSLPEDIVAGKAVPVSDRTFDAVKTWADTQAKNLESRIKDSYSQVSALEHVEAFKKSVKECDKLCAQHDEIIQRLARVVQPLVAHTGPTIQGATRKFTKTARDVKESMEKATVALLARGLPYDETIAKLEALKGLSERLANSAQAELGAGGALTKSDSRNIVAEARRAADEIIEGKKKSWL